MLNARSYDYCSVEKIEEARRVEPRGSMLCYGLEYQAPERRVSFRCLFPIMIIIGSATDGPECCDGLSVLQVCCGPNRTTLPWKDPHPHDGRVGDEWTTVDNDPRDPAFYSTVWMKEGTHTFDGPQCGTDCTPADPPPTWRIGDKCIDCECVP